MIRKFLLLVICIVLLTGCGARFQDGSEDDNEDGTKRVTLPTYQISNDYYYSVLPFVASAARGLIVGNLDSRADLEEFEMGLMRLSQEAYPTEEYFFQEGQALEREVLTSWLQRKYTKKQLEENDISPENNLGLNPAEKDKPMYLAHILEQRYLVREEDTMHLGGLSIGLALNAVHRINETDVKPIPRKKVRSEGQAIADEVLMRLRAMDGLAEVPITIALYEQNGDGALVPGNFIAMTHVDAGANSIGKWEDLNERYYLFPSSEASEKKPMDFERYSDFKEEVEKFFPNFTGAVGQGFYVNDELQNLNMTIPMQFFGKMEVVSFTQFVTGKVLEIFPASVNIEVSITSHTGPEALITRTADEEEPMVYIYR